MNFITNYISCLEGFSKKNHQDSRQAKALAEKLKILDSFAELRDEIDAAIQAAVDQAVVKKQAELFTKLTENPYVNQLKRWKIDLEGLDLAFQNAMQTIKEYPETSERLFVDFIHALLKDERCIFHVGGLSLAKQLERADNLTGIIKHLSELEEVAAPESPRQGTFDAIVPENDAHERCLALLRKNSKFHDGSNEWSDNANGLLQTILSIHRDLHHPDFFPEANPSGFCHII